MRSAGCGMLARHFLPFAGKDAQRDGKRSVWSLVPFSPVANTNAFYFAKITPCFPIRPTQNGGSLPYRQCRFDAELEQHLVDGCRHDREWRIRETYLRF